MPWWIVCFDSKGKMPGLRGPYLGETIAQKYADRMECNYEIISTVSSDPRRAKRELKEKLIREKGYEEGSRRIRRPVEVSSD